MTPHRIMIFADALFDTVAGTVSKMNRDLIIPMTQNGYHSRTHNYLSDFVPSLDMRMFKQEYGMRDSVTLRSSLATMALVDIAKLAAQNTGLPDDHPEKRKLSVTVNMWPFRNSEDGELYEVIRQGLRTQWKMLPVHMTYIHPAKVSPQFIAGRFEHVILYNFNDWYGLHQTSLPSCPIPDVAVTLPLIMLDDQRHEKVNGIERAMQTAYAQHLNLEVLPLEAMSFINPDVIKKWGEVNKDDNNDNKTE